MDAPIATSPIVLIVDDEPDLIELVSLTLSRMNLATDSAADLASARALLDEQPLRPVPDRHAAARRRRPRPGGVDPAAPCPELPVAVITAHGNVESAVRALKLGAFDFVSKPLDLGVLRKLVATAIKLGDRRQRRDDALPPQAAAAAGPLAGAWRRCAS